LAALIPQPHFFVPKGSLFGLQGPFVCLLCFALWLWLMGTLLGGCYEVKHRFFVCQLWVFKNAAWPFSFGRF
jgi:hypothetical protein